MDHPHPTSSRRANAHIPGPLQHTVSMTPPPPYVPLPPASSPRTNHTLPPAQGLYPAPHPGPTPHQQGFGPTPISTSLPLLPYAFYESFGAAAARARWRFVGAVMIALGIYLFVAAVVGLVLLGEMAGSL